MRKICLSAILSLGCMHYSYAQTEAPQPPTPPEAKKERKMDHTVGVQLNTLIRQVLNFSNSTSTTNVNPYLLTYNMNSKKSGWGLRAGLGYNYNSTANDDGITKTSSNINDVRLRVGGERAFRLSDKWSTGVGIDAIINMDKDKTTNTIRQSDTVTTTISTDAMGFGGGGMAWLRYSLTRRIQIGTEASFYFVSTKNTNKVTVERRDLFSGGVTSTETTSKPTNTTGNFTSPIVFYISVRF